MSQGVLYSYAYLRVQYETTSHNPVDLMLPLAVRALAALDEDVVLSNKLQASVLRIWGLNIPQNVIRFMLPKLKVQGHLQLKNNVYFRTSVQSDAKYERDERKANGLYQRVQTDIKRLLVIHGADGDLGPDEVIERFLDTGGSALLSDGIRIPYSDPLDLKANVIIADYLGITTGSLNKTSREDLESLVIGDVLFKAISSLSESDLASRTGGRMEDVEVYLDTPVIMRMLRYEQEDLRRPIQEMMRLALATGCRLRAFRHTADEVKSILVSAANNTSRAGKTSELDRLILAKGFHRADILEDAEYLDSLLHDQDIQIVDAPLISESLGIDELALDTRLQTKIGYRNNEAKIRDISSLASIFRLREGRAKDRLENCRAIFITTNFNLALVATEFFNALLRGEGDTNVVQHCMTDVIFTMRLWLKVPSQFEDVPRSQIIAHTLATLRPREALYNAFVEQLDKLVERGLVNDDVAIRSRLAALVTPTLVIETGGVVGAVDEGSTTRVVSRVLEQEEEGRRQEVKHARVAERADAAKKLADAEQRHATEVRRLQDLVSSSEDTRRMEQASAVQAIAGLTSEVSALSTDAQIAQERRDRHARVIARWSATCIKLMSIMVIGILARLTFLEGCERCAEASFLDRDFGHGVAHSALGWLSFVLAAFAAWGISTGDLAKRVESSVQTYVRRMLE